MPITKHRGRYEAPIYLEYIHKQFQENFPDNVPSEYIIDNTIKYFLKYIENQLLEEKPISLFAFGKFYTRVRISPVSGETQYYPKLKFSRHFILRMREAKGTCTEVEKKELDRKRAFMRNIWSKRKEYMLEQRGKLPQILQDFEPKYDSDIQITNI